MPDALLKEGPCHLNLLLLLEMLYLGCFQPVLSWGGGDLMFKSDLQSTVGRGD